MSVTDKLYLSQTSCICHRQSLSVTDSFCLSDRVCGFYRQSVFVTDSLCLSQTFSFGHRQSVFVTDTLCMSKKVFFFFFQSNTVLDHPWPDFFLNILFIKICLCDFRWYGISIPTIPFWNPGGTHLLKTLHGAHKDSFLKC